MPFKSGLSDESGQKKYLPTLRPVDIFLGKNALHFYCFSIINNFFLSAPRQTLTRVLSFRAPQKITVFVRSVSILLVPKKALFAMVSVFCLPQNNVF
jgi:hypothetical protein